MNIKLMHRIQVSTMAMISALKIKLWPKANIKKTCNFCFKPNLHCKYYIVSLPGSIDRELDSIDRKSCRLFFLQNFQLSPSPLRIRVQIYFSKYIKETLSTFLSGCLERLECLLCLLCI